MGTIHTSVATVINFMDSVTQTDISSGSVQVSVEQKNKVIWKEGGCAVIIDKPGISHIKIYVKSMIYICQEFDIDIDPNTKPLILNIWLSPSRLYPFTRDMKVMEGVIGDKQGNLYMVRISKSCPLKLITDADPASGQIKIWGFDRQIREMIVLLRDADKSEIAVISGINGEEPDCYYLKERLKNTFHKQKTRVYPAVKATCDSDGKYIMAFKDMADDEDVEIFFKEN